MTDPNADTDTDQLQSVIRAFRIVEALETNEGMTMSELADEFDIPPSTAHIYLKTLANTGYIVRDENEYHLGLRFLKHGGYVRHRLQIYQAAKSEVDALARRTGEAVDFGIEENNKRVLAYKSEGPDVVTQKPVTGDYAHMHMTALGKAMLSTFDRPRVDAIVDDCGLPKATQYTIDNREDLYADLEQIRDRGYSVEAQERREGIRAVGVPIDLENTIPSAISISGPMSKLSDARIDELQQQIHDSVNVIEIKLRNY
ncbi:IclR family transcriptional regulator [Halomicroarcula sp. GCM10025324]|uniref:IclR family transcriptional regulator n=1 Tax=Haloarcula TaxID=2237 RepID=UPI0023E7F919|nr:IclR family transcriptional regulator [Halomicroarcula sp. ZS-22-S1]